MPPVIDLEKCSGCANCDRHCPLDVIVINAAPKKAIVKYADECWHCGVCRRECPQAAISIQFPVHMLNI